jgi:hypothetical protein
MVLFLHFPTNRTCTQVFSGNDAGPPVLRSDLKKISLPIIAVVGNHYHENDFTAILLQMAAE